MDVKLPKLDLSYAGAPGMQVHYDAGTAGASGYQGSDVVDIVDSAKETEVTIDLQLLYKMSRSATVIEVYKLLTKYFFGDLELPVQAKSGATPNPDAVVRAQSIINRLITKYIPIDTLVDAAAEDIWSYGSAYWEYTIETIPEEGWVGAKIEHREAFSFSTTPPGKTDTDYLIGKYLLGVMQHKKTKEWEFWQTPDPEKPTDNVLIKYNEENHGLIHIREQRGGAPDGRSYLESIAAKWYDQALARRRLMQATNR